jgi:hypothetical protein
MTDACSPDPRRSTDLRRRVKDKWVDWDEHIRSWKRLALEGEVIITDIANARLSSSGNTAADEDDVISSQHSDVLKNKLLMLNKQETQNELQRLSSRLSEVYDSMRKLVERMEQITTEFGAIVELDHYQCHKMASVSEMLFDACDTTTFYEASRCLSDQYRKELSLKQTISENVALASDRNLLLRYKLTWRCEPYILATNDSLLEANLVATGLKK